jgi:hypothetical protein
MDEIDFHQEFKIGNPTAYRGHCDVVLFRAFAMLCSSIAEMKSWSVIGSVLMLISVARPCLFPLASSDCAFEVSQTVGKHRKS